MQFIDALSTFAEFSIGLAGFSGIVIAVLTVAAGDRNLLRFRFSNLLNTAFAPGFSALIAVCLIFAGLTDIEVIRISSTLLAGYFIIWSYSVNRRPRMMNANPYMTVFMWSFSLGNLIAQSANIYFAEAFIYLGGLAALLLQGAVVFAVIALSSLGSPLEVTQE